MSTLSDAIKCILNGLAMQHQADYLSDEDKQANLQRVLEEIKTREHEHVQRVPTLSTVGVEGELSV